MKTVILAGGLGTRIGEESRLKPKPMIELGGMPIIWHVMKLYSHYGFDEFVICAGYKQEVIKQWFADYFLNRSDVTFDFTGGGREYIGDEPFMMTYGDGVCDVDINDLIAFHRAHGKIATLTAVVPEQQKGILDIGENNSVRAFREKSAADASPINAGFMVLEPKVFDYLGGDDCVFEREPLERLAADGELKSYVHRGFWQCMDNMREHDILEKLYAEGKAPWRMWE